MVERYRQLINVIKRKNAIFQHAKQIVENATEKAQNKFFNAQNVTPEKCDIVVKVSIKDIKAKRFYMFNDLTCFLY